MTLGQGQEITLTFNTHISFDLAAKYVKVTPRSSFEQTMMGRMLHTKFDGNWPAGSGEDF